MLKSIYGSLKRNWMCVWSWSGGGALVAKSCPTLETPWTVAHKASLPMGFSRQEYWTGLPSPSPRDLPNSGTEPWVSCTAGRFFTHWATRSRNALLQIPINDKGKNSNFMAERPCWYYLNQVDHLQYYQHTIPADIMHWEGTPPLCFTSPNCITSNLIKNIRQTQIQGYSLQLAD